MSTQVTRRRGTTAQHATFTGAQAELTVDTDKKTVVVHDGITAGGFPLQKEDTTLTALASVTQAADKLPYFTGATSVDADVTTLTAFARSLLDDVDAAAARATLGVGTGVGDMLADGSVPMTGSLTLSGAGTGIIFEGTTADAFETTLVAGANSGDWDITLPNFTTTLAGTAAAQTFTGDQSFTDNIILTGAGKGIVFEGTTADAFETTLTAGEPTADRTITLADNPGVLDPEGYTSTVTAGATTTLTTASTTTQFFTGAAAQTCILPVTSTLFTGKTYTIVNNSTGQVTVQSSGANNILVMGPQSTAVFTCILTSGTTAASWENVMLGYKNIPINSQSAAYTTVLSDAGKTILHPAADTTARTFTIDSNANVPYPIGTAITFVNETLGGIVTIAITSDTLLLAGAATTGSRSLAASNIATAVKITTTKWIISGSSGLT